MEGIGNAVTTSNPVKTRPLELGDLTEVLELMRLALGEPPLLQRTTEHFAWKHFDNPFGHSIGLVAESDQRIVGLRTFMRWELATPEGDRLRCVRAVDTATHPDYQRRGIFRRLTEEALEIARDDRVDMIFNTPNAKSKLGYLSMGWIEVGPIGAMVRPSWRMATRRGRAIHPPIEDYLEEPVEFSAVDTQDRSPRGLRTPRTRDYLSWRYTSHPMARYYQVAGDGALAVVRPNVRNKRRELVIADLFGSPGSAIGRVGKVNRSDYLATWFPKGSPERRAVVRRGILPVPGLTALTLVMRPLRSLPDSLFAPPAWDVSVSDFELL